jgi:chemosensory pili system protein ChpA (sensor histidine kinase/response regulator)
VVDDSVSVRNSTTQLLQDTGYEVLCARDGMEALDILQNCTPDIVLADLEMPRMNGLELTRALRGREQTRLTPVLMITSRFTARHQALARSAGVNAFQAKPFAEDELLQVMGELLVQPGAPGEPDSIMPAWTNDSNPASP